ncbi:MAG: Hydroxylamine reductase [Alphaproteobacteria bacterium ADurb.Bin438]|nr:MAG: Hydroxylamine reductase [Alphaproteobacteria bacterium ADurb.Bin438]
MGMFCYQCEQTAKGTGCSVMGVCGKSEMVANGQDELIRSLKIFCYYYDKIRDKGQKTRNTTDLFAMFCLRL